jgi:diadenosine tetraphosphate (Ap4A) HIT family hydrolase
MPLIEERVLAARAGTNPKVFCRMRSGWAVIGDVQFLPGYCLLLSDPVVPSLNELSEEARLLFLSDMARIGDAILSVTHANRINYEILGNSEPELHAHIFPRYADEPDEKRRMPVWFYDWKNAPHFSPEQHGELFASLRNALKTATPLGDEIAFRGGKVQ